MSVLKDLTAYATVSQFIEHIMHMLPLESGWNELSDEDRVEFGGAIQYADTVLSRHAPKRWQDRVGRPSGTAAGILAEEADARPR